MLNRRLMAEVNLDTKRFKNLEEYKKDKSQKTKKRLAKSSLFYT